MKGSHLAVAATCAGVLLATSRPGLAHRPITSPFTFDEDVRPILQEHCVSCHVNGGVAPMSLMTHADTVPWAESMRVELVAGHMPPWGIEGGSQFTNTKPLTARELNVLLTWAAGGTPRGTAAPPPTPEASTRTWPLGEPDLKLQPAREYVMAADVQDHVEEFTLDTGVTETRRLRAVDVLPGDPTIVRSATVSVVSKNQQTASSEPLLALWVPGDEPVSADAPGFVLPAGAQLTLRIRYKKTWQRERDVVHDRSTVGVYFGRDAGLPLVKATLEPPGSGSRNRAGVDDRETWPWREPAAEMLASSADAVAFSRTMAENVFASAVYADPGVHGMTIEVQAIGPNGSRQTLIAFRPQADWVRRYWFRQPTFLPSGTRIEVRATRNDAPALLPPGAVARPPMNSGNVRLFLNVFRAN